MTKQLHCNRPGCDVAIIFARRPGGRRPLPYEATDREPFTDTATGAHVVIAGQAWTPGDAIEDFRTRFEIGDAQARTLIAGYPWHRPHIHERDDTDKEVTFP